MVFFERHDVGKVLIVGFFKNGVVGLWRNSIGKSIASNVIGKSEFIGRPTESLASILSVSISVRRLTATTRLFAKPPKGRRGKRPLMIRR